MNDAPDTPPTRTQARQRHPTRRAAAALGVLAVALGCVGVGLGGVAARWLATDGGGRWVTAQAQAAVPGLTLNGLSGLPFHPRLARLSLSSGERPWLVARGVALDLDPVALLAGLATRRLPVERLAADSLWLDRPPSDDGASDTGTGTALPLAVSLGQVDLPRLELAPALLGLPADAPALRLGVTGQAHLARDLEGRLDLRASGGFAAGEGAPPADRLTLTGRFAAPGWKGAGRLDVTVDAQETPGPGAILARLFGQAHDDLGPIALSLNGAGPLDQWRGVASVALNGAPALTAQIDLSHPIKGLLSGGGDWRLRLDAKATPTAPVLNALLPRDAAALLAPGLRLGASLTRHDGGALSLTALDVDSPIFTLHATGEMNATASGGTLNAHLTPTAPPAPPQAASPLTVLLGGLSFTAADLTVAAAPAKPVDPAARPMALTLGLTVQAPRLPDLPTLAPESLRLDADGLLDTRGDGGTLRRLALAVDVDKTTLTLNASGHVAQGGREVDGTLSADDWDLARLFAMAGTPIPGPRQGVTGGVTRGVTGRLGLQADVHRQGDALETQAHLSVRDLHTGDALADRISGGTLALDARARLTPASTDAPASLLLDSLNLRTGDLRTGTLNAQASGRWRGPEPGLGAGKEKGQGRGSGRGSEASAALSASGALDGQPLALTGRLSLSGDTLALDDLSLTVGPDRVHGDGRASLSGKTARGRLTADLPDLSPLGRLTGTALSGKATLSATVTPLSGNQRVELAVTAGDLSISSGGGAPWRLADLRAQAVVDDALGRPQVRAGAQAASVTGLGASGRGMTLDHLRLDAAGGIDSGTASVSLDGRLSQGRGTRPPLPLRLDATGGWAGHAAQGAKGAAQGAKGIAQGAKGAAATAGDSLIRLDRLSARVDDVPLALTAPATLTLADDGAITLDRLRLTAGADKGQGSLDGHLSYTPAHTIRTKAATATIDAQVTVAGLPLALAALADPALPLSGSADATLAVRGSPTAPDAQAHIALRGVALHGGVIKAGGGQTAGERILARARDTGPRAAMLDATLDATLAQGALSGRAAVTASDHSIDLDANLATRLPGSLTGSLIGEGPDAPSPALSARLAGHADLARLSEFTAAGGQRLAGRLDADLTVSGTQAQPRAQGTIDLRDGRVEDGVSGAVISALNARLVGDAQGLTVARFDGTTPDNGSVHLDGGLRLPDPQQGRADTVADLHLTTHNARLVRTDPLTAWVDSDLTLTGPLTHPRLAGTLTLPRTWGYLPDHLPTQVVDLPVREINGGRAGAMPAAAPQTGPQSGPVADLDLHIKAANQIYVEGRGLTAELAADLQVTGTSAAPRILGPVTLVKGDLSALGQTFTLSTATVTFTGDTDPLLDVSASTTKNDFTAILGVTGRASAPKVAFTSDPAVPQEEVLSRLLFSKGTGQLSTLEALQLANSAAQMSGMLGGGGGFMSTVKRTLGIDRLEFSGDTGTQSGSTAQGLGTVSAGRYINDRTYLGVSQTLGTNQSNVTLEYQLTKGLRLNGAVGTDEQLGIKYQWDYP